MPYEIAIFQSPDDVSNRVVETYESMADFYPTVCVRGSLVYTTIILDFYRDGKRIKPYLSEVSVDVPFIYENCLKNYEDPLKTGSGYWVEFNRETLEVKTSGSCDHPRKSTSNPDVWYQLQPEMHPDATAELARIRTKLSTKLTAEKTARQLERQKLNQRAALIASLDKAVAKVGYDKVITVVQSIAKE